MTNKSIHEIVKETYIKLLKNAEEKLHKLYNDELSQEDKKLISFEKFASYYTVDIDVEYPDGPIGTPVLKCNLRLKTIDEM